MDLIIIPMIMDIFLIIALFIASLYDLFNKNIVPISISVIGFGFRLIEIICLEKSVVKECIIVAIVIFGVFYTFALFTEFGGADCLLCSLCGLYLGMLSLYALLFAFALSLPQATYTKVKKEKKEYAFVPYIFLGTLLTIIIKYQIL